MTCDVCNLPDPYDGGGDGIGSCECPRCEGGCGFAAGSQFCTCPPDDDDLWMWTTPVRTVEPNGAYL